ncbi:DUF1707 domain-containing protein [uncultured Dietzia sp.]|uniref:DUF1707 SHOCT-like domain-containing protein n=1 Tax=uncultured Dietzia sp. TaxID=395519 RepID=UPI0025F1D902|nr:DUF1707 domain-containing protein [uncultured Dietzia sp.]
MTEPSSPDPTGPESAPAPDLLLSDAERLHALTALGDHYAAGRLDDSEFHARSGDVAAARTLRQLRGAFSDLPGGMPLTSVDGMIVQSAIATESVDGGGVALSSGPSPTAGGVPAHRDVDAELAELRKRGKTIEALDGVVVGVTLVAFLILQFVVGWNFAWIVWPSLALTLGIPRLILRYNDDDEATYEKLKKADQKAREDRLRAANDRIRELGDGREGRG